jgi:hypothetical protein
MLGLRSASQIEIAEFGFLEDPVDPVMARAFMRRTDKVN